MADLRCRGSRCRGAADRARLRRLRGTPRSAHWSRSLRVAMDAARIDAVIVTASVAVPDGAMTEAAIARALLLHRRQAPKKRHRTPSVPALCCTRILTRVKLHSRA